MKLKDFLKQFEGLDENTEVLPSRDGYNTYIHHNDDLQYFSGFEMSSEFENRGDRVYSMKVLVLSE